MNLLRDLMDRSTAIAVLTGAGCSTGSSIPDYRSPGGVWSRYRPILIREFLFLALTAL